MNGLQCGLLLVMLFCSFEAGFEDGSEHSEKFRKEKPARVNGQYTKKFVDLLGSRSFQATEMGRRILGKVWEASVNTSFGGLPQEYMYCPERLLHIAKEQMNCRGVANKLEQQLNSIEIYNSVMRNKILFESLIVHQNCTKLTGKSFTICDDILSSRLPLQNYVTSDLNLELDNCFKEEMGNRTNFLTKR